MLSRVLSGKETERAHPFVIVTASLSSEEKRTCEEMPPEPAGHLAGEYRALQERYQVLERESAQQTRRAYEQGFQDGDKQARAELEPIFDRLNAVLVEITSLRPDLRRRAERDVVQLALLIARRVLHRELSVDEEALTALARFAFDRLAQSESYDIRVHPRFADRIGSALPKQSSSKVHIQPDPNCAPGTLVIRTGDGAIDASVEAQLEEIARGLTDRIKSA
jgi:flagellar assembly protein FliH